jgi:hypothetical protein
MPDNYADPSGNTQAFRTFAQRAEPAAEPPSKRPVIIGVVAAAVVVIALLGWFALN